MKTKTSMRIRTLVLLGVFTAIILMLSFTPLGFLPGITDKVTFLMLPVLVGAAMLGPWGGAVLGLVFGLASFVQCFGMSWLGTTMFGLNPFFTILLCLPTRVLAGALCGLIYRVLRRKPIVAAIVTAGAGPLLNTILFVGVFTLCFGQYNFTLEDNSTVVGVVLAAGMITQGLFELAATLPIGSAVLIAIQKLQRAPREIG